MLQLQHTFRRDVFVTAQDALVASLQTLLENHNIGVPQPSPRRRGFAQPPMLERFTSLRAVVTNMHHMVGASSLPALSISVRELTLDAGWVSVPVRRCGS